MQRKKRKGKQNKNIYNSDQRRTILIFASSIGNIKISGKWYNNQRKREAEILDGRDLQSDQSKWKREIKQSSHTLAVPLYGQSYTQEAPGLF